MRHARRSLAGAAALILASGLAGGCATTGGGPSAGPAAAAPAPAPEELTIEQAHALVIWIAGRIDFLETRVGTWERGPAFSSWRAEIGPAGPEFIEERMGLGGAGLSLIRYFFVSGRLILYQEEGDRPVPGDGTARRPFDRTIFFCTSGRVISATGHLDGRDTPPDDAAIAAAVAQAAALRGRAPSGHLVHPLLAPGTPPPPDLMHPRDGGSGAPRDPGAPR